MNDPISKQPAPKPHPDEHHLQKDDLKREADSSAQPCVPLVCTDEECFVPGSELDACALGDDVLQPKAESPDDPGEG